MTWRTHAAAKGDAYRRALAGERALRDRGFKQHEIDETIKLALNMPDAAYQDGTAASRFQALWARQGKTSEQIAGAFSYHEQVSTSGRDPYDVAPLSGDAAAKRMSEMRALMADPSSAYWEGRDANALQVEHMDLIQAGLDREAAASSSPTSSLGDGAGDAGGGSAAAGGAATQAN